MFEPSGSFAVGFASLVYSDLEGKGTKVADISPDEHLVGAIFYPGSKEASLRCLKKASWVPQYGHAAGFIDFIRKSTHDRKLVRLLWPLAAPLAAACTYLLGHIFTKLPAHKGLALVTESGPHPVVLLSHGAGGNRMVQSCVCCELASQGFVVLSVEHSDGSASAVRLASKYSPQWRFFQTMAFQRAAKGEDPEDFKARGEADRASRILFRLREMRTAARLLRSLSLGESPPGLSLPDAAQGFAEGLRNSLDMDCVCTIGHSFGGGPSCALPVEDTSGTFKCGIGMDPYWPPLPDDHPVFTKPLSPSPLLIIGCEAWNDPTQRSFFMSAKEKEAAVVKAASRENGGGGSIALVMRGIGHASFTDAELLFRIPSPPSGLGAKPKSSLAPPEAMNLLLEVVLTFLKDHLPLTNSQACAINPQGPRLKKQRQRSAPQLSTKLQQEAIVQPSTSSEGVQPSAPRTAPPVDASEEELYRNILGNGNIYSLHVVP